MSKMSELDLTVKELRNAAQAITAAANSLVTLFTTSDGQRVSDNATVSKTEKVTQKPKPVTLEQVRAVLAEKSRSGHTADVRELLQRHGVAKLSEIDSGEYGALLAEAAKIGLMEGRANG
ncbi:MAG: DNA ligase [Clostridiales bacterium]|jgi:hypothetical protein|nr:DNA ligase [Clostridiales bacterium]